MRCLFWRAGWTKRCADGTNPQGTIASTSFTICSPIPHLGGPNTLSPCVNAPTHQCPKAAASMCRHLRPARTGWAPDIGRMAADYRRELTPISGGNREKQAVGLFGVPPQLSL